MLAVLHCSSPSLCSNTEYFEDLMCRWLNHLQEQFSSITGFFTEENIPVTKWFPFLTAVKDTVHPPPPLWLWLNDTTNPTLGSLVSDQTYKSPLSKLQIQLSLMLAAKMSLKVLLVWFHSDTLNVITATALSVPLPLYIIYQLPDVIKFIWTPYHGYLMQMWLCDYVPTSNQNQSWTLVINRCTDPVMKITEPASHVHCTHTKK